MSGTGDSGGRLRILLVGVGGQGVLTAARVLGDAALAAGLEPMVGQLHGMAQRGGSVEAAVVLGAGVSAFIGEGAADVLLGFEPLEALRALPRLNADTRALVNRGAVTPFPLSMRGEAYPAVEGLLDQLRAVAPRTVALDGSALLQHAVGHTRSLNMLMLGALAARELVPLTRAQLWQSVERRTPPRLLAFNQQAFELGEQAASGA